MRDQRTDRRRSAVAAAVLLLLAAAAAAPGRCAADEAGAEAYRSILEQRSPAVVTVRFVLDIQLGGTVGGAMGDRGQEVETEISGVVVDPAGLVLCSNTLMGGFAGLMGRLMGGGAEFEISATPKNIEVLVGDSTEGLPARLVARDTDLDLAWLRLEEAPASALAAIDLSAGVPAHVGQQFVAVRRFDKIFARAPGLIEGRIGGEVVKPRRLLVPAAQTSAHGLPVFDLAGDLIGVTVLQFPDDETLASGGMAAMWQSTRLAEVLSAVILPAAEVARATELAREIEAERSAGEEATEPAPAEESGPAEESEPEMPAEPDASG